MRVSQRSSATAAAAALVVLCTTLAGCTSPQADPPPSSRASSSESSTAATAPSDAAGGGDAGLEGPTASPHAGKLPTWSQAEAKKARAAARAAVVAFVDSKAPAKKWRANLSKHLAPGVSDKYQYTDPSTLPYGKVTKVGKPEPNKEHPMFVTVPVTVEGGQLSVELVYSDDYKHFGATNFTPSQAR